MSKYYLVKTNKELTDYNIADYDNIIDLWVELTKEELQEIECWMNKNSQDIINNEHLCKIVEKIRKVLDND